MRKIVFVLERLANGGAERVTVALANYFSAKEIYEVHILTCVQEEKEYILGSNVFRHSMVIKKSNRLGQILGKIKFIKESISEIGPTYVVSLATPKTSILLTLVSLVRNYRLILSERNDPNQYPRGKLLKALRTMAYMICDGIVFQTKDAKNYFNTFIQKKSVVIPNPVSESLPERYIGEREKKIVNFCRLEPQKNLPMLIHAYSLLNEKCSDYTLELFGEGPQKEELMNLVKNLNLEGRVVFKGYSANIYALIRNAALFVSSSNYEGISNSMIEAIAMGIPSICTDCPIGGAKMIIDDRVNGILVPVDNLERLSMAMYEVLSNRSLADKLSINGAELRKRLHIEIIAKEWQRFIEEGR